MEDFHKMGSKKIGSSAQEFFGARRHLCWSVTFVSLIGYSASVGAGGALSYMPLLCSTLILFLAYPKKYAYIIANHKILYLIPLMALISTAWSPYPETTFKLSVELTLHTSIAIIVASTVSIRTFISAFLCSLFILNLVGFFFGGQELIYTTGEFASNGFYGSKNNFALFSSFLYLFSVCVLFDKYRGLEIKTVAICGLTLSISLLGMTKSVGAITSCFLATSFIPLIISMKIIREHNRQSIFIFMLLIISILIFIFSTTIVDIDSLLRLIGKSSDLTGRTVLWERARRLMDIHPWLGTGYQAFWVQGNPEAEALWQYGRVANRSGFHFHNTYYAIGVELGYLGIIAQAITIIFVLFYSIKACLKYLKLSYILMSIIYFSLLARLFNEVDGLGPFSSGAFFTAIVYVYCKEVINCEYALNKISNSTNEVKLDQSHLRSSNYV